MKAVVFHGIGDIRLDEVPEPKIQDKNDAIVGLVKNHTVDPEKVLSQIEPMASVIEAYQFFDERKLGWTKVELLPQEELAGVE